MEEKVLFDATALFLAKEDDILLAWKMRKINKDRWNAYGGGIEKGELPSECVVREIGEETGGIVVKPQDLEKIAIVDFHNTKSDGSTFVCRVHTYIARKWTGEIHETNEMTRPTWFKMNALPFDEMPPADRDWIPLALEGKKVIVKAYLGPFQKEKLRETEVAIVDGFPEEIRL